MGKLSNTTMQGAVKAPAKKKTIKQAVKTKSKARPAPAMSHGWSPNVGGETQLGLKSELFQTSISTFAGEDSFYESGQARINRIVELTHKVTAKDDEWMQRFIPWLRGEANMRTISLIIAAEYVCAGGERGRAVIDSVCQRADEPAEILAWWIQQHYGWDGMTFPMPSPKLPQALRKGLADATRRLYSEYNVLKYNGNSRGIAMSNVLDLIHPKPVDDKQGQVFKYIVDRSRGREPELGDLTMISEQLRIRALGGTPQLLKELNPETLRAAGMTWESLGGLLPGGWTAEAWEAMIPSMGYMALIRNLRNFEGAGISKPAIKGINERLSNPDQVARSRQLPFRFLSAYENTNSAQFKAALEDGLDLACRNLPSFPGRTLIMLDKSGSMDGAVSGKSTMQRWKAGAVFAMALALKGEDVDLSIFASSSKRIAIPRGASVLSGIDMLRPNNGVGHGTAIWPSVRQQYDGHDRVVIFTDMKDNSGHRSSSDFSHIPFIHFFDLAGLGQGVPDGKGENGRFMWGGLSDQTFKLMALQEQASTGWPF